MYSKIVSTWSSQKLLATASSTTRKIRLSVGPRPTISRQRLSIMCPGGPLVWHPKWLRLPHAVSGPCHSLGIVLNPVPPNYHRHMFKRRLQAGSIKYKYTFSLAQPFILKTCPCILTTYN